jgi:hypothetical protein
MTSCSSSLIRCVIGKLKIANVLPISVAQLTGSLRQETIAVFVRSEVGRVFCQPSSFDKLGAGSSGLFLVFGLRCVFLHVCCWESGTADPSTARPGQAEQVGFAPNEQKIKPTESISICSFHFNLNLPQASRLLGMTKGRVGFRFGIGCRDPRSQKRDPTARQRRLGHPSRVQWAPVGSSAVLGGDDPCTAGTRHDRH